MSLMCAASRNFRPPNFTNGMLRRVSSISSGPEWLEVRNSTACCFSSVPDSRFSRMRLDDAAGLVGFVAHRDQPRLCARSSVGPEVLGETLLCQVDHAIGGGKDRLRRAVVAVERDDVGGRRELPGEVEDVAHGRGAERIDRLGVVADHGEAAVRPASAPAGSTTAAGWCPDIRRPAHDRIGCRCRRQAPDRSWSAPSTAAGRRNRARSGAAWPRHRLRTTLSAQSPIPRTTETRRPAPVRSASPH